MSPRNEQLLYYLLWTVEPLFFPSWRSLNQSFESWAWENRLTRRLGELEKLKLIERYPDPNLDRIVRLTQEGQRLALGGRVPPRQWSRPWDGRWRMILFDIPIEQSKLRQRLRRILRGQHFGCLQGSVWVTPDSVREIRSLLGPIRVQADALLVVEGRPAAGESDQDIVLGAWLFKIIQLRYDRYLKHLDRPLPSRSRIVDWLQVEDTLWRNAILMDPLLPQPLLPTGYRGREAFERRQHLFHQLCDIAPAIPASFVSQV